MRRKGTDKDDLIEIMERFGCEPVIEVDMITLEVDSPDVRGYYGFRVNFEFADDGKFISVGIYE